MVSATVRGTTTTFAYRGDGLRDSRTTGGDTTTFTWDIGGGLPVVLDDGSHYVYGLGLVSQVSGANTYYYLPDGLGSTMAMVDGSGTVVKTYGYDVYGKVTSSSGSVANEFDFAGQQTDPTGLQYLRARYYDSETGTLLSRDPLNATVGWGGQPYQYGMNSPAGLADPTGLSPDIYPKGGNAADRRWCKQSLRNGLQCRLVSDLAEEATRLTDEYFGAGSSGTDGTAANAFKHCVWIGLTACNLGSQAARGFGIRHETLTLEEFRKEFKGDIFSFTGHKYMDLSNNDKGIGYYLDSLANCREGSFATCAMLAKRDVINRCRDGATNGDLVVIFK